MTRADRFNALLVVLALGLGALATTVGSPRRVARRDAAHRVAGHVIDASGAAVKVDDYRRIVSGSLVGDRLLVELVEPDRVLAFSSWGTSSSAWAYQYEGRPRVDVGDDIERVLAMRPDLVLVSNFVDAGRVARLRAAGIVVFDLGPMHGVETLLRNSRDLAALLGHPERGERLAHSFTTRMDAVAADVPESARPRAVYLGIHASQLYGGTRGSSFHDVLRYAGTVDAASARYFGWPTLTSEQILELDPDVVVTQAGKGAQVCRHAGLEQLRACTRPHGVVEVDDAILNDPSFAMLDAAEAVRLAVHGPPRAEARAMTDARLVHEDDALAIHAERAWVVARFRHEHAVLSWAIVGGGFRRTRTIAIHEVKNAELPHDVDPVVLLESRLAERGEASAVGLLTSRDLAHVHVRSVRFEDAEATALVTAGLSNAVAVGDQPGPIVLPGTINIVCRVGIPLSPHGLVEALSIAVEARTAAVLAANVSSRRSRAPATGTGTDCVVIASPIAEREVSYAGKHTALGHVVGRAVLEATSEAVSRWKETVST